MVTTNRPHPMAMPRECSRGRRRSRPVRRTAKATPVPRTTMPGSRRLGPRGPDLRGAPSGERPARHHIRRPASAVPAPTRCADRGSIRHRDVGATHEPRTSRDHGRRPSHSPASNRSALRRCDPEGHGSWRDMLLPLVRRGTTIMAKDARARKVSVSITAEELAWARSQAKAEHVSVSAVVSRALRVERQMHARRRVIERLGIHSTPKQREEVRREWQG